MHEAEDVVNEQQHVLLVDVAEVLSHGQSRETHAHAGARGLVHLAVAESHLRLGEVVGVDHARLLELLVEVVALAGALAHTGEHRYAAVLLGDVVNKLLDQHGFAHTGAAEEADLAALAIGGEQVDDLDTGLEDFWLGFQLGEAWGRPVDRCGQGGGHRAPLVDGFAEHVEDAAKGGFTHGHAYR